MALDPEIFFLIMPVMARRYLVCLMYLLGQGAARRRLLVVILISVSTPLGIEFARSRNSGHVFSWLSNHFLIRFTWPTAKMSARPESRLTKKTQALLATVFLSIWFLIFLFSRRMSSDAHGNNLSRRRVRQRRVSRLLVYQNSRNFCTTDDE